jgi:1-acyl-sn-glycerol-3-phosphate acyltransferase
MPEATTPMSLPRRLRLLARIPLLALHVLVNLPLALLLIQCGGRIEAWAVRTWSRGLLAVLGMRVRRIGQPLPGAVMFVANHIGWIDIVVLHSQRLMGFVAKSEIERWPLIGGLAKQGNTIFHRRGSQDSLNGVQARMVARLGEGRAVGVFPEGRTRDGHAVGPFHARIFQAAIEAGVPVQPVALGYGAQASAQSIVAFRDEESFFANFVRLLGEPARVVEVHFLAPQPAAGARRALAHGARAAIVHALGGALHAAVLAAPGELDEAEALTTGTAD